MKVCMKLIECNNTKYFFKKKKSFDLEGLESVQFTKWSRETGKKMALQ